MLKIFALDQSAESRARLVQEVNALIAAEVAENDLVPRLSVKPVSPNEIKFLSPPDLCLIGPEIVINDLPFILELRKIMPNCALVVRLAERDSSISLIERLGRLGVDDVISSVPSPAEFLKRVILLCKRRALTRAGKLILVDSAKGGLGVSSLVAALSEALLQKNKRVLVVDLDFETQDLSRFLQVKPCINENLQLLMEGQRPITQEVVSQCYFRVWNDAELYCMPPQLEGDQLHDPRSGYSRILLSILELLDSEFDQVIVDCGAARGLMAKALYHSADKIIFVLNNDPASIYASVSKLSRIRAQAPAAELKLLENAAQSRGLSAKLLRTEFNRASQLSMQDWFGSSIPFCRAAQRWPGSGGTMFSHGSESLRRSITNAARDLGLLENQQSAAPLLKDLLCSIRAKLKLRQTAKQLPGAVLPMQLPTEYGKQLLLAVNGNVQVPAAQENIPCKTITEIDESEVEQLISGARFG